MLHLFSETQKTFPPLCVVFSLAHTYTCKHWERETSQTFWDKHSPSPDKEININAGACVCMEPHSSVSFMHINKDEQKHTPARIPATARFQTSGGRPSRKNTARCHMCHRSGRKLNKVFFFLPHLITFHIISAGPRTLPCVHYGNTRGSKHWLLVTDDRGRWFIVCKTGAAFKNENECGPICAPVLLESQDKLLETGEFEMIGEGLSSNGG